jgi:hypothetical protein
VIKCSKVKGSDNVAEKRNDIIEEQRRARQEFLKLKQMQNGEIEPEAKPSEIAIKPTTFSEKWQELWTGQGRQQKTLSLSEGQGVGGNL